MRSGAHRARITLGVLGALVLGLLAWAQPAAQAAQARQAVRGSQSPQVIWARQVTRPGRVTRVIRASRMARAGQVPGDEHPMIVAVQVMLVKHRQRVRRLEILLKGLHQPVMTVDPLQV